MAEQLKNVYSQTFIEDLAHKISLNYNNFQRDRFIKTILNENWDALELKQRMRYIAITLNEFLPFSYDKQLEILKKVKEYFKDLQALIFQDFVEVFGLESYESSIEALKLFTINSSSEFAIRQFILKYEDKTLEEMKNWAKSSNEHIRRLACEGCRPRLPWAVALVEFKKNPFKILEIIELLKNDESLYVRKSVANNLNDISKDNPKLVIEFVKNNLGSNENLNWICKHASRTLLKKGNKDILKLFRIDKYSHINISNFQYDKKVVLGEFLNFSFDLSSDELLGNLRVEYEISYLKSNNTYSKKSFMIHQKYVESTKKRFLKKQIFREMTTRKHYFGKHFISILVNGKEFIKGEFELYDTCY